MPRLIIRSGPFANQEFPLQHGTNHVGRAAGNDICVEEPSISSSHCHIVVGDEAATIIDLNSTNGTFVNQSPVQSERLKPGDLVHLGSVECVFVGDTPVARPVVRVAAPGSPDAEPARPAMRISAPSALPPEPPRIAPPVAAPMTADGVPEAAWCKNHHKNPALYYCRKCHKAFCELCVAVRHVGHVPTHNCRLCANDCVPIAGRPQAPGMRITNFYAALPQAFAYPLKAEGLVLLCVGTMLYLFIEAATYVLSLGGLFGLAGVIIMTVFGVGYIFSYMKRIIASTAEGNEGMPDWPDFTDWGEDILVPFFQMLGTLLFSFLPLFAVLVMSVKGMDVADWLIIPAIIAGCLYYPMGLLSVALHDTIAGLNPLLIVPSIFRVFGAYLVCCLVVAGIFLVRTAMVELLPRVLPVPIFPYVISGFVGLYLLTTLMRVIGLLYLAKKDELGWFNR